MSLDHVSQPFTPPVRLQINYAAELNEQQLAAVTAPPGPSLVIAGAGSGKTRTLTYRVAYLLEQGIPPDRILLLTFTNKAAGEMMRRVAELLGQELPDLWGGTFHSIGNRILRRHAGLLGRARDFSIMDREDARHMITSCVAESGIDTKAVRFPKAEALADLFSMAANTCKSIPETVRERYRHFSRLAPEIAEVEKLYAERRRASNALDFDDLLTLWLKLLTENPDILDYYQRRFQFILVDEYQDTNRLQSDLVDLLAARHHNVMVVGDDAQSIYAWRGANYENILRFNERYPESQVYKIETNYRSTPEILCVANAAIRANVRQFAKQLAPERKTGIRPVVVVCNDASQQAAFVAQRVAAFREAGADMGRVAVLYRSHFHAMELQMELTRRRIPFSITSGTRFFEQAHIKDVTAWLKLVVNPRDELAFKRLAQLLPGIGRKGAGRLWEQFSSVLPNPAPQPHANGMEQPEDRPPPQNPAPAGTPGAAGTAGASRRDAAKTQPEEPPEPRTPLALALRRCGRSVSKKTAFAWKQFEETLLQLDVEAVRTDASQMIRLVIEAGYEEHLKANYANYRSRLEDVEQLAVFARQFDAVTDFLTQLALLSNLEAENEQPARDDERKLRLSTIHQAKGLEFDVVFVIMLCDGLFPSSRALESNEGPEEERRLMYVAITRARNELYLCYPRFRAAGGGEIQKPSRFLMEIPESLVEVWDLLRML